MSTTSHIRQPAAAVRAARLPRLREASFADHEQIARLQSRYGLLSKGYDAWSHLWLGNPLYRELRSDWSIGWVLEDDQHQIVGSMGNIPLLYEFQGRRVLAASGCNWVAEPAYRSVSLLLLDRVINQRGVDLYVNNTVSAATAAAVRSFDCVRVPVGQWDRSALWTTNYWSLSEHRLARRRWPFAKTLGGVLAAATLVRDRLTTRALGESDVEVTACPGFDCRFDDFWSEVTRRHPHRLMAVRSRDVLQWHYEYAQRDGHLWIAAVVDGPGLAAYATFQRRDKIRWGVKHVRLVDFQSLDGGTALLLPLVSWALKKCHDEGIHTLEIMGRWLEAGGVIAAIAPRRQALPTWKFVYRANDPGLAERLMSPHAWAPSLFDGDASL